MRAVRHHAAALVTMFGLAYWWGESSLAWSVPVSSSRTTARRASSSPIWTFRLCHHRYDRDVSWNTSKEDTNNRHNRHNNSRNNNNNNNSRNNNSNNREENDENGNTDEQEEEDTVRVRIWQALALGQELSIAKLAARVGAPRSEVRYHLTHVKKQVKTLSNKSLEWRIRRGLSPGDVVATPNKIRLEERRGTGKRKEIFVRLRGVG